MLRILVVDDDPLVWQTVQLWLRQQGFDVVTADGAASGLAALEQSQFDLMIIDIFMPHMHGFDSVRLFHRSAPSVPLIAISGYAFAESHSPAPDFLRMALALGATRCLRKPFKPRTLLAVIDECLVETRTRSGMGGLDMADKMAASRVSGIETRKAAVSHHTEN